MEMHDEGAVRTVIDAVIAWFDVHERDLPWRHTTPWGVMVSEIMLQQTQVARVVPVWQQWMQRWPTPADLAAEPVGEAVRAWGRLGYPRRAQRLHLAARHITDHYAGQVPTTYDALIALPGVGDYTAAAIASFAFGARVPVIDTNVRRVWARLIGDGQPRPGASATYAQAGWVFTDAAGERAARWAEGVMELGALVCTSRKPLCKKCPIASHCAWKASGYPASDVKPRTQSWAGTDRQCRGRLLDLVRASDSVPVSVLLESWHDQAQAQRCLDSLHADHLITITEGRAQL